MKDPFKNIDQDLLLRQKEELSKGILDKEHSIDTEVIEGVLNLLDAITDNAETINNTELCECGECGYSGNTAMWKGSATLESGATVPIEGPVKLVAGTFELDNLLDKIEGEDVDSFGGDYYCPICGTNNIQ